MSSNVRTPCDVGDFPIVGRAKTMRTQLSPYFQKRFSMMLPVLPAFVVFVRGFPSPSVQENG